MGDLRNINVTARFSLLHTITNSIYSSPRLKIKEAVTNSIDNNATIFLLHYDSITKSLSLIDNGCGISEARMKVILENIGFASDKENCDKHSYFGLGLFSILELGETVYIFSKSRTKSISETNTFIIKSKEIFAKDRADTPLAKLNEYISSRGDIEQRTSSITSENTILNIFGSNVDTFTEIYIENVNERYCQYFEEKDELIADLTRVLPIGTNPYDQFFNLIKDEEKLKEIKSYIGFDANNNLCETKYAPSLNFYVQFDDMNPTMQYKYYPKFDEGIFFTNDDILTYEAKDKSFVSYFLFKSHDLFPTNTDTGLDRTEKIFDSGLWVRNRNVLVKGGDFFQKSGYKKSIVQEPLKKWIFGEIFHHNMEDFLIVTRDDYEWSSNKFIAFYEEVKATLNPLNKSLRTTYNITKQIDDSFIKPLKQISDKQRSQLKLLENKMKDIGINKDDVYRHLTQISNLNKPLKDNYCNYVANTLATLSGELTFVNKDDVIIKISNDINQQISSRYNFEQKKSEVIINANIFYDQSDVEFYDSKYKVVYVLGKKEETFFFDFDLKIIYINIQNSMLQNYTLTVLDVLIAFEIAYIEYKDKPEQLKNRFYELVYTKNVNYTFRSTRLFAELEYRADRDVY